jgi:hypothetical protein
LALRISGKMRIANGGETPFAISIPDYGSAPVNTQ